MEIAKRTTKMTKRKPVLFFAAHYRFIALVLLALIIFCGIIMLSNKTEPFPLFLEALEEQGTGNHQNALEILRQIEINFPNWDKMENVYFQEGNIYYFHKNDIPAALNCWTKVIQLNPDSEYDFTIHSRMAEIYQNVVGDMNKAVEQWRYLIKKYPDHPETDNYRLNIANTYVRTDQFETALIELKNLLAHVQNDHQKQQISLKIGMIYSFQKNYRQAQEMLEKIVESPHCDSCRNLALLQLVDILEALENYQKAIDILNQIPDNVIVEESRQSRIDNIRKKLEERP